MSLSATDPRSAVQAPACRLCGAPLPTDASVDLPRAPKAVQFFPSPEDPDGGEAVQLSVSQCTACGLAQLAGEPIIYGEGETSATAFSPAMSDHRRRQMASFVERFGVAGRKILDVGAGDGHLVGIMREEGLDAVGIEPSSKAQAIAEGENIPVLPGMVSETALIEGAPFDAFVSMHVLEHVTDPNDFLRGVRANLAPGGVGMVEVPNFEQVIEGPRFYDILADHLSYFSAATLRLALEKNGFEVEEVSRDWHDEHLVALVRRREPSDLEPLRRQVQSLPDELNAFLEARAEGGERVALWGASHNAVTLLAAARPRGIAYVVDSATYKQGRLTPVSRLPIVEPGRLADDPVDVVLILAPRYREEIVRQLRESGFAGEIVVVEGSSLNAI